ncbi:MAG: class I SAM-dependent methyltransferase [Myxococcota bacterium]
MSESADQAEFWNGPTALKWLQHHARLDALLAPFGDALIERANPAPGERAIEVGSAHGTMAFVLAEHVGESGSVLGVDLSRAMIDMARGRTSSANLRFEAADASTFAFDEGGADLLVSRFGVMFFSDPVGAFRHLRRALRPGGRLTFVCWQALERNPWMYRSVEVADALLSPGLPPKGDGPGAFSLADPVRIEQVLGAARFEDVEIASFNPCVTIGDSPREAAAFILEMGPVAARLHGASNDAANAVRAAVETAYGEHAGEGGVRLPSAAWLVHATSKHGATS